MFMHKIDIHVLEHVPLFLALVLSKNSFYCMIKNSNKKKIFNCSVCKNKCFKAKKTPQILFAENLLKIVVIVINHIEFKTQLKLLW